MSSEPGSHEWPDAAGASFLKPYCLLESPGFQPRSDPYHQDRIHDSLEKDTPSRRPVGHNRSPNPVLISSPRLGGLSRNSPAARGCRWPSFRTDGAREARRKSGGRSRARAPSGSVLAGEPIPRTLWPESVRTVSVGACGNPCPPPAPSDPAQPHLSPARRYVAPRCGFGSGYAQGEAAECRDYKQARLSDFQPPGRLSTG